MKSPLLSRLKAGVALTAIVAQLAVAAGPASAFCGFYVAQADAKAVQQIVQGRSHAQRPADRDHHGERLRGRTQ